MKSSESSKGFRLLQNLPFLFFLSFCLWLFAFHSFILNKLDLTSDALAYYEHFKVFTDAISRGVYPMWDPFWDLGIPLEFFLRRIGSFNPFILVIIIFNKLGLAYIVSYLLFLSLYFFFGLVGFYLLAEKVLKDKTTAFVAYLLLMFSSLGTRLFDSYILLTFVPMVWFFYFLVSFSQKPTRFSCLGLTFALMILFTTYIPFYFITILITFVLCFLIVYFQNLRIIFSHYAAFFKTNKIFVVFCFLFFLLALWPGYAFYLEGKNGEMIFPDRHATSQLDNQISVGYSTVTSWGIEEDMAYATAFTDLKQFKFAIIYVSFWAYLILLLGWTAKLNKRLVFLFLWECVLILITTPRISGIYDFLYNHIFYFKYFRNLHFFLWFILLPIFILFLAEQLKSFLSFKPRDLKEKILLIAFITIVHAGFALFIQEQGANILSSFLTIILSWIIFVSYFSGWLNARYLAVLFLIVAVIQPMEVYHYLSKNVELKHNNYRYSGDYLRINFPKNQEGVEKSKTTLLKSLQGLSSLVEKKNSSNYIGMRWLFFLHENLNTEILGLYTNYKLMLYDRITIVDDRQLNLERISYAFAHNSNMAVVSPGEKQQVQQKPYDNSVSLLAEVVTNQSNVKILAYDFNVFKLRTNLDKEKFLVYIDSYHSEWQVFLDGKKIPLYRANLAFKGAWIPSGDHVVEFRFGTPMRYFRNYFLLFLFYGVFGYLLYLAIFVKRRDE